MYGVQNAGNTKKLLPGSPGRGGGGVLTYMSYMGRPRGLAPPFQSQSPALLSKVSDSLSNRTIGWDF